MTEIRQGKGYWVQFGPASGSEPTGRPPCVAVQSDLFNRSRIGTTVVCVVTSNLSRAGAPGNVLLDEAEANLPKTSGVNVSQIVTVDKEALAEYLRNVRRR